MHQIILIKSWWFGFVIWFGNAFYGTTPFKYGELISMKLFPILADVLLGIVIFKLARKVATKKWSLILAFVYLFSPFGWFISAVWGQNDQLGFLPVLLGFLLLFSRFSILSPILFTISVGIKPTSLIFLPIFFWIVCKNKLTIFWVLVGSTISLFAYSLLVKAMSSDDLVNFTLGLQGKMFIRGEWWTWANAFNFWHLVTGYLTPYTKTFLFVTYKMWGYIIFGMFNLFAFIVSWKRDLRSTLIGLFVVAFSAWLFLTTMHDRYLFPALVFGLILCAFDKRIFKYWVVMSVIFAINLYNEWWFLPSLDWLKSILIWNDLLVARILSLANVLLFLRMTTLLVSWSKLRHDLATFLSKVVGVRN